MKAASGFHNFRIAENRELMQWKSITEFNPVQHSFRKGWLQHSRFERHLLSRRAATTSARSKTRPQQDLEPVGTLEKVLVEKIAMEYWRLGVAASHEARELEEAKVFLHTAIDRILRYQTTINRQLYQAMIQLERLQRLRKGDNVHAPHSRSVQPPLQT